MLIKSYRPKIGFVILSALLGVTCPSFGQGPVTNPVGGGGGGGGGGAGLTVTITTDTGTPVIIGTETDFNFSADGTAPYTEVWSYRCGADPTPWVAVVDQTAPFTKCWQTEGSHEFKLHVTDSNGDTGEDTITIEVQGPDKLTIDQGGPSNASTGPGSVMSVIHKFYAKRGGDEVESCWQCPNTTVYEIWSDVTNYNAEPGHADDVYGPNPPADPKDWAANGGLEGCSSTDNDGYYWVNPYIKDKLVYIDPGLNWAATPVGTPIMRKKQWVAIRVPICGDPTRTERFVIEGPIIWEWRVAAGSKIEIKKLN